MTTLDRQEYNDWRNWENIEFDAATADDYTIDMASGTDTATTKYLNKTNKNGGNCLATGFILRPDKAVGIVQINNQVFRNPITVSTAGFAALSHTPDIRTIVIRTTIASTNIKLLVT